MNPSPLHCLIYSHAWNVFALESALPVSDGRLLVELAQESHLAPVFGAPRQSRPGLAPLLAPPMERPWFRLPRLAQAPAAGLEKRLNGAIQTYSGLPLPLLLAADPPLPKAALESAIALLSETPSRYDEIILLVHIVDVPWLLGPFQYAEKFSVLWDIADLPSPALPRMAEALTRQNCLSRERWGGFHLCENPVRARGDADERRAAWQALLGEFPSLATLPGAA